MNELLIVLTSGNLEWLDKNKSRCLVMWRRPEEWGKLIYQWVSHQTERQGVLSVRVQFCPLAELIGHTGKKVFLTAVNKRKFRSLFF